MAVFTQVKIDDYHQTLLDRLVQSRVDGTISEYDLGRFDDNVEYYRKNIAEHTFNPETDTVTEDGRTLRFHADTIGRTYALKHGSTYHGDGDSSYYTQAIIINDDGSTSTLEVAYNGWVPTNEKHFCGSTVDAADDLIDAMFAYNAEKSRLASIRDFNADAEEIRKGDTIVVVKGRKVAKGTTGVVFWIGENRWGTSIGFNDAAGNTHWTAVDNASKVFGIIEDEEEKEG